MQHSLFTGGSRVAVSTHGTKALPFERGFENSDEPPGNLDEAAQSALVACGGCIDQEAALNWLPSGRWPDIRNRYHILGPLVL
jgi:hypothetical protein